MKRCLSLGLFSLALTAWYSCDWRAKHEAKSNDAPAVSPPPNLRIAPTTPLTSPDQIEAAFRLGPDRRCLWAVAELHRLLTGTEKAPTEASFRSGRWQIGYRGQVIGELPEFPDFPDLLRLLTNSAARLQSASKARPETVTQLRPEIATALANLQPLSALQSADRLWPQERLDTTLARQTAQALALLAFLDVDAVEAADAISARALALLALSETLNASSAVRERCMLAKAMGYESHAFQLAAQLAEDDPLRLFLLRQDEKLAARGRAETGKAEARYLWARRLAERHDLRSWKDWVETQLGDTPALSALRLPLLRSGFELNWFESNLPLSSLLIVHTVEELKPFTQAALKFTPPGGRAKPENLLLQIESALAALVIKPGAPFLDRELLEAHFRGSYYSGLMRMGLHYLDALSSIEAANAFGEALGETTTRPAAEFKSWYLHLAQAKAGSAPRADLQGDLAGMATFGEPLLARTYEQLGESLPDGDLTLASAGRVLAVRLDTRPSHRVEMGLWARDFFALSLAEKFLDSAIPVQGFRNLAVQAWHASIRGDWHRVEELLRQPELDPQERNRVLTYLKYQDGVTDSDMRREYEGLIGAEPDNWRLTEAYADYLDNLKDWKAACQVVQTWIDRKVKNASEFDHISAHNTLARMYYRLGRYPEGLAAVEPVVDSWQFGAMQRKALLLDRLGREAEAVRLADAASERYPDSLSALLLLSELDWRHGRPKEAAIRLAQWRYPISSTNWRFAVGPVFVECFQGRDEEALQAAGALIGVDLGRGHNLGQLAAEAAFQGNPGLAFEIQSRLRAGGLEQLELFTDAYGYLKRSKGEAAALDWLRARVPDQGRMPLAMFSHRGNLPELLWEVAPASPTGFGADYYWLMRAAAVIRPGSNQKIHLAEVRQYFENNKASHYDLAGRYLLGLAGEKNMLAAADTPKAQCELFYFIGYKAQCQGRIRAAADWYWLSIATGLMNNGEARWAYDQLYKWRNESRTLARLTAKAAKP